MTDREKLIELLKSNINVLQAAGISATATLRLADHLIANGVTFAKDTNVPSWIPVTERLPDLIQCDAGTAYSEAVNILTSGRKVLTAIWDGEEFISDAEFWEADGEEITHWTPVLLPLPKPPKEVDNG